MENNNNTKKLKLLSKLPMNEANNIRYYARIGRMSLTKTVGGYAFDEDEYKQARINNKRMNTNNLVYITNEDLKKEPYIQLVSATSTEFKYRYMLKKTKIAKCYNTDDYRIYVRILDLLQGEIAEICSFADIEEDKLKKWIKENSKR